MTEEIKNKIIKFTKNYYRHSLVDSEQKEPTYYIERYLDYRDEFPKETIAKILESDCPSECLSEEVFELECNCDYWNYENDFWEKFETFCEENEIDESEARDVVYENFSWTYPESFLNPTFNAIITLNTGDMNYDYTLHNVCNYASGYGYLQNARGALDKKAGLYWLAKQQGRLGLLQKEILKSDHYHNGDCEESSFVASCITELVNLPTHMSALTFLVKMDLNTAVKILDTINEAERNKKFDIYHPLDTKGCPFGYLKLSKDTECGLFDAWQGSGSVLEIELEKDVKIPLHLIRHIYTDKLIQSVYGLCGDCWKETVLEVA